MAVWNCQAVGKLNLANRVYAKDQLQLCESGEVRYQDYRFFFSPDIVEYKYFPVPGSLFGISVRFHARFLAAYGFSSIITLVFIFRAT